LSLGEGNAEVDVVYIDRRLELNINISSGDLCNVKISIGIFGDKLLFGNRNEKDSA